MIFFVLVLILASAACHAAWNIIAKNAYDKFTFLWLQMVVNVLVLAVPVLVFFSVPTRGAIPFLLLSGLLQTLYYLLLAKTYTFGEIALVYPLIRGSAPVFVALLSLLSGLETVSVTMFVSILIIVFGIYIVNLQDFKKQTFFAPFQAIRKNPTTGLSFLLGIVIAIYTIIDKINVTGTSPFMVFYVITVIPALLLSPFILKKGMVIKEVRKNKARIMMVAFLTFLAYVLVLIALRNGDASFISPVREISIVFVALYSALTSKEKNMKPKLLGSLFIFTGILCLSLLSR